MSGERDYKVSQTPRPAPVAPEDWTRQRFAEPNEGSLCLPTGESTGQVSSLPLSPQAYGTDASSHRNNVPVTPTAPGTQSQAAGLQPGRLYEGGENVINKAVASGRPVVLMLGASWCGPCKSSKPHFLNAAKESTDTLFIYVDVNQHPTVSDRFGGGFLPALMRIQKAPENILVTANVEMSGFAEASLAQWLSKPVAPPQSLCAKVPILSSLARQYLTRDESQGLVTTAKRALRSVGDSLNSIDTVPFKVEKQVVNLILAGGETMRQEIDGLSDSQLRAVLELALRDTADNTSAHIDTILGEIRLWCLVPPRHLPGLIEASSAHQSFSRYILLMALKDERSYVVGWLDRIEQVHGLGSAEGAAELAKALAEIRREVLHGYIGSDAIARFPRRRFSLKQGDAATTDFGGHESMQATHFSMDLEVAVRRRATSSTQKVDVVVADNILKDSPALAQHAMQAVSRIPPYLATVAREIRIGGAARINVAGFRVGDSIVLRESFLSSDQGSILVVALHEIGHVISHNRVSRSQQAEWQDAIKQDIGATSFYSLSDAQEDFAETFAWYIMDPEAVRRELPARAKLLDSWRSLWNAPPLQARPVRRQGRN